MRFRTIGLVSFNGFGKCLQLNWIVGYSTGYGFIGFGGFGWLSEDLDISFLLVQRCKKLSMPLNLFGLERFFFDKWNKITGKR